MVAKGSEEAVEVSGHQGELLAPLFMLWGCLHWRAKLKMAALGPAKSQMALRVFLLPRGEQVLEEWSGKIRMSTPCKRPNTYVHDLKQMSFAFHLNSA